MSSTPQSRNTRCRSGASPLSVTNQVGVVRALATSFEVSGTRKRPSTTRRTGERSARPGSRQVSSGSSARTVLLPITELSEPPLTDVVVAVALAKVELPAASV